MLYSVVIGDWLAAYTRYNWLYNWFYRQLYSGLCRVNTICDWQVEQQSQSEGEKQDIVQRIADREEALHQANVSSLLT